MSALSDARIIAKFVRSENIRIPRCNSVPYTHMGGLLCDAVLQAGLNYEHVVRPRVDHVISSYPDANDTPSFYDLLLSCGPRSVLRWNHDEKPRRLFSLTFFLLLQSVRTVPHLHDWLQHSANLQRLKHLRGVGPKTTDYLCGLSGIHTVAIDRHLVRFLEQIGISHTSYQQSHLTVMYAADLLEISRRDFDYGLWIYMNKIRKPCTQKPTRFSSTSRGQKIARPS